MTLRQRLNRLNGTAKWVLVAFAVATVAYNTVVTHTIVRNDVKHLQADVVEVKEGLATLYAYLLNTQMVIKANVVPDGNERKDTEVEEAEGKGAGS